MKIGIVRIGIWMFSLLFTLSAAAQTPPKKPMTMPPASTATPAKPATVHPDASMTASALPSTDDVNEFLRRMFGYDPSVTWTIQGIAPTEAPGVSLVVATVGGQQRTIRLFALPGGKFAVVGEMIPFGADPFAPVRDALAAGAKGVQRGPAKAPVTIVEFSDLQCPFCRSAQPIVDRLVADIPEIRLVFQPFPLPMHKWAMKAASYAECVAKQKQDAFWEFVNGVYDDQTKITDTNVDTKLAEIATTAGVNAAQVATCADSPAVYLRIQQSIELGKSVGVNSTPTLFLNGRRITGIADIPYDQLKSMVAFEAAEARKRK